MHINKCSPAGDGGGWGGELFLSHQLNLNYEAETEEKKKWVAKTKCTHIGQHCPIPNSSVQE